LDEPVVAEAIEVAAEQLAASSVARARLTVLGAGAALPEHRHDNPYLSLHLLGSYRETDEAGEVLVDGPSAAFHPAGSVHGDAIGARGLATVVIELDPGWAGRPMGGRAPDRSRYWIGGRMGRRAAGLARAWLGGAAAEQRFAETWAFLAEAMREPAEPAPAPCLDGLEPAPTSVLARRAGVTPAWLARAYRQARGEGLRETWRRLRIETAVQMLEAGEAPLAEIACAAGFCDQSHMNRAFRQVLGRTPADVRTRGLARRG
jgi:AraC family transcriptional regulator